jgi:acetolactate synthase regulatory subunit
MSESETAPAVAVRFMLDADPDPGLLPRLLTPFARRGLVPDRMWSHRGDDAVHVEVALEAAPAAEIHLIEGNLRQVVGVRSVTLLRRADIRRVA